MAVHGSVSLRRVIGPEAPADGWPLRTTAEARAIEALAAAGLPDHALMQRAGTATARLALALAPHAARIWIAAGPGNNGGDGLEAAAWLRRAGKQVEVGLHPGTLPPDAATALQRAVDSGASVHAGMAPAAPLVAGDLAIDAVFGLGLSRAPQGWGLQAVHALNASAAPVLAVDVPTGLDSDRGCTHGADSAVRARWTLSLLTLKPGLFTGAGRDHAGDVWFDDLGTGAVEGAAPVGRWLLTRTATRWPVRRHDQHKGSFGDVWVVGGADGMVGAALLAARAALAAGAGRVHCVALGPIGGGPMPVDPSHPELMLRPPGALQRGAVPLEQATVVCGCGGGDAVRHPLPLLLGTAARLVLDADALNDIAADATLATQLRHRAARGLPTVATPHPLEAARLLQTTAAAVQADRLAAAVALAGQLHCTVVLKGSGSVLATPQGSVWINGSGNAALATAGTGDVLAGWLGGLWSQWTDALQAAQVAVHSHGLAADHWRAAHPSGGALEASRLVDRLRQLRES